MSYHMHECTTILCHDSSQLSVRGIFDNRDRKVAALQHCLAALPCSIALQHCLAALLAALLAAFALLLHCLLSYILAAAFMA